MRHAAIRQRLDGRRLRRLVARVVRALLEIEELRARQVRFERATAVRCALAISLLDETSTDRSRAPLVTPKTARRARA